MYKHWLSDEWLLFFFCSCLSWKCVSFLPPLQISALSEFGVMGRQTETGPGGAPGLHQTHTRYCSRKTVRNREALLGSVAVYHQNKTKKMDLERAVLHTVDGGVRQVGSGVSQQFSLLFVSVLFCSALSKLGVQGREKMRISGLMSSGNSILIHL